ncbi:MAG TPA: MFS transporter, partial [Thermomonospora sp.]|nr:MFS transporter [Thermomonospora sp.]
GLGLVGVGLAGRGDWGAAVGCLVLAALVVGGVGVLERGVERPLLRWRVVGRRPLVRSAVCAAALNGPYWGLLFLLTFQLQGQPGWSAWRTAVALLPAALPLALTAGYSGLVGRFGAGRLILVGAFPPLAGYVLYLSSGPDPSYVRHVLPTLLLIGAGFVLQFTALHVQAMSGVPEEDRAMTGAAYQTAVQLGGAVTLAAMVALLPAGGPSDGAPGTGAALLFITAVSAVGLLAAASGNHRKDGHGRLT